MRCFIGLPLPETYQRGLRAVITHWKTRLGRGMSWTKPENWHLTLKFLGDVPEKVIVPLQGGLREPLGGSFALQARGGGFFPNPLHARVLWVGIGQGAKSVRMLTEEVDRRCAEHGFAAERRGFTPHLTVARIRKSREDHPWTDVLTYLHKMAWPQIEADNVVLWESRLTPEGPLYRQVAQYRLTPVSKPSSGAATA